ncbi:MAG: cell envelope integrity EipB family protein [Xanthobacteraceae bacterium]|nr:cell envelope integrity EipB family protein [Xanthobacteraceae bacterium]
MVWRRSIWLFPLLAIVVVGATVREAAAQAVPLVPHRAIYELALDPNKASNKIDRATGRIAFEVTGNACEGYAVSLRQVTELDSGEGRKTVSDLRSITWEDGAAKSYRFKTQNYLNEDLKDEVDGSVERAADGGFSVRLAKPKAVPFPLRGPILLPTEHLRKLIVAGGAGERILEAKVYDGAPDGKKVYETLSVIGAVVGGKGELEEPAKKPELVSIKRYPVTVSYFDEGAGERTPSYVLGFELYENGVSRALRLDYGGFALRGDLKSIEFLKTTPCPK